MLSRLRAEAAAALNSPGVFHSDLSAKVLFQNFDAAARGAAAGLQYSFGKLSETFQGTVGSDLDVLQRGDFRTGQCQRASHE